jgi:hypothetical protein
MLARDVVPGRDLALGQARGHLLEGSGEVADLLADRGPVREIDVTPHRRVRPGHARRVAKARPHLAQRLPVLEQPSGGLGDEHVGQHVREVTEDGDQPVVRRGIDGHRSGAEVDHEAVEPFVEQSLGVRQRGQVPDRALKEVRTGVLHSGGFRAGDRMPADEALVVDRTKELLLRRADVGHGAVGPSGVESRLHEARQGADRSAGEAELAALERIGNGGRDPIDRPQLAPPLEAVGISTEAHDVRVGHILVGGEADRAANQPDAQDGNPQTASSCFPASSATASTRRR